MGCGRRLARGRGGMVLPREEEAEEPNVSQARCTLTGCAGQNRVPLRVSRGPEHPAAAPQSEPTQGTLH